VIITGIVIIGLMASIMLVSMGGAGSKGKGIEYLNVPGSTALLGEVSEVEPRMTSEAKEEVEVKEGSMNIESEKAEEDFGEIKSMVENYQGYVEKAASQLLIYIFS